MAAHKHLQPYSAYKPHLQPAARHVIIIGWCCRVQAPSTTCCQTCYPACPARPASPPVMIAEKHKLRIFFSFSSGYKPHLQPAAGHVVQPVQRGQPAPRALPGHHAPPAHLHRQGEASRLPGGEALPALCCHSGKPAAALGASLLD